MARSSSLLQTEYESLRPRAEKFLNQLHQQIGEIVKGADLHLGIPIEHRVKSWESIAEKIDRKSLSLESLSQLPDIVGLRLVFLFNRDVEKACTVISHTFTVVETEDTASRLADAQFGYRSRHFVVQIPNGWTNLPSFVGLSDLKAEIQVRTLSQHIWAAAEHILQYKREESIPPPIRRAVYRVSALLETVDLEFERVLDERSLYVAQIGPAQESEPLNVELLKRILDELLPSVNKAPEEKYADLFSDLIAFEINSPLNLRSLIAKHLPSTLRFDIGQITAHATSNDKEVLERLKRGVFFKHVGLVRVMLESEFGEKYRDYRLSKAMRGS